MRGLENCSNALNKLLPTPPALILEGPATENKILNSPAPPTLNIKAGGGGRECKIETKSKLVDGIAYNIEAAN